MCLSKRQDDDSLMKAKYDAANLCVLGDITLVVLKGACESC